MKYFEISDCWYFASDREVKHFQNWGDSFEIEFVIKVYKLPNSKWMNIFKFTTKGEIEDHCNCIPELYIFKDQFFRVCSMIDGQSSCQDFKFELGKEYKISIKQFKYSRKYWFQILINNVSDFKIQNTQPKRYQDVTLYANAKEDISDETFDPEMGSFCYVKIHPGKVILQAPYQCFFPIHIT